jgi:hypothetical protein
MSLISPQRDEQRNGGTGGTSREKSCSFHNRKDRGCHDRVVVVFESFRCAVCAAPFLAIHMIKLVSDGIDRDLDSCGYHENGNRDEQYHILESVLGWNGGSYAAAEEDCRKRSRKSGFCGHDERT